MEVSAVKKEIKEAKHHTANVVFRLEGHIDALLDKHSEEMEDIANVIRATFFSKCIGFLMMNAFSGTHPA